MTTWHFSYHTHQSYLILYLWYALSFATQCSDLKEIRLQHALYICLRFPLPLRMIIIFNGQYIVHLHRQCERGVICIYLTRNITYIYNIAYFLFSVPFCFLFRFSNTTVSRKTTPWHANDSFTGQSVDQK